MEEGMANFKWCVFWTGIAWRRSLPSGATKTLAFSVNAVRQERGCDEVMVDRASGGRDMWMRAIASGSGYLLTMVGGESAELGKRSVVCQRDLGGPEAMGPLMQRSGWDRFPDGKTKVLTMIDGP
jgi:hypothetical protein